MITVMTRRQMMALHFLWNKYGNGGACHTLENQRFFVYLMDGKFDDAERVRIRVSVDCKEALARVEEGDYGEFRDDQRKMLQAIGIEANGDQCEVR